MVHIYTTSQYWFFVGKFIFTNLILTAFLFMFLSRLLRGKSSVSSRVLLLLSLGIGPGLVSLLLYYLMLLFPGISHSGAFTVVALFFTALGIIGFNERKTYFSTVYSSFSILVSNFRGITGKLMLIGTILFLAGTFMYLNYYLMSKQITEHDTLEYTIQGDIFYRDMSIGYSAHRYDETSGFYYVGLHGFTFPLLKTWDNLMNNSLGFTGDHYFRSVNMFYGTLLLFLMFVFLYRYNAFLAVTAFIATFLTYGFFETYMKYHIDNMRVFYLVSAFILLYECIRKPVLSNILLLALLMGLQANSHSMGAMICFIELGVLFFFLPVTWGRRFALSALVFALMILFGGIHYVLDVTIGTGWILQEVKFY